MTIYDVIEKMHFNGTVTFTSCGVYTSIEKADEKAVRIASRNAGSKKEFHVLHGGEVSGLAFNSTSYMKLGFEPIDHQGFPFSPWGVYIIQKEVK